MRRFKVTVNGNIYEVDVEEIFGQEKTELPAMTTLAAVTVPKQVLPEVSMPEHMAVRVEAPMQGKIVSVKVKTGNTVKAGDVIAVLEAMKMENEVVAPADGTLMSIHVTVGQSVEASDLIATLN